MFRARLELRGEVRDQQGRVTDYGEWVRANSLLKAFVQILGVMMDQVARSIKDTGGTNRNQGANAALLRVNNAGYATGTGPIIGTGTTPVTQDDFALAAQATTNIAHGNAIVSVDNPSTGIWRVTITKTFVNNTGALLAVKEVGLIFSSTGDQYPFLVDRTLFSKDVPIGSTLTILYRLTITL